ncbi:MAG: hypothetical protein PVH63_10250 [Balneolaceae bacterium]
MDPLKQHITTFTIAVLPFENLSIGNESELLCKSFSLDLITELSRFKQFQIISFDSVKHLQAGTISNGEMLENLMTNYFIRGSFRARNDCIRINIQLFDSVTHHLIWADRFEGDRKELLELQENILKEVVSSLQQQLNYNLLNKIRRKPKTSLKAYECWLYGYNELKKGSLESDLKARDYFEQAIKIDPGYSLAYSGMSLTFFNEWSCQLWDRWEVSQNGAYEWAQKALELDEQNYVASYILGRILLYKAAYSTAEYFLRKSLRLNANDPDSLIQIALCFNYLGYQEEAYTLYEKSLRLNPAVKEAYYPIGAIILFELGQFSKSLELFRSVAKAPYVDLDLFKAAVLHEIGDEEQMTICLDRFITSYNKMICREKEGTISDAVHWVIKINPYKDGSRIEGFLWHITQGDYDPKLSEALLSSDVERQACSFLKEDEFWKFSYLGQSARLKERKGFIDIQKLLQDAGTPVHCTELMGIPVLYEGEQVFDQKAKRNYQKKIRSLQNDIALAERRQDFEKAGQLQEEYEQILEHLTNSLGLQGKIRNTGGSIERARSAVTWRIRSAISKIEEVLPALGKHLSNSVQTGTFCSYEPEKPVDWNF